MALRYDIRIFFKAKYINGPSKGTIVEQSLPFVYEDSAKKYIKDQMKESKRGRLDYLPYEFKIVLSVK